MTSVGVAGGYCETYGISGSAIHHLRYLMGRLIMDAAIRILFKCMAQRVRVVYTLPFSTVVSLAVVTMNHFELVTCLRFDTVPTFPGPPSTFACLDCVYPGLLCMCILNLHFALILTSAERGVHCKRVRRRSSYSSHRHRACGITSPPRFKRSL